MFSLEVWEKVTSLWVYMIKVPTLYLGNIRNVPRSGKGSCWYSYPMTQIMDRDWVKLGHMWALFPQDPAGYYWRMSSPCISKRTAETLKKEVESTQTHLPNTPSCRWETASAQIEAGWWAEMAHPLSFCVHIHKFSTSWCLSDTLLLPSNNKNHSVALRTRGPWFESSEALNIFWVLSFFWKSSLWELKSQSSILSSANISPFWNNLSQNNLSQQSSKWLAATALPGNLLQMQVLGPHPSLTKS